MEKNTKKLLSAKKSSIVKMMIRKGIKIKRSWNKTQLLEAFEREGLEVEVKRREFYNPQIKEK